MQRIDELFAAAKAEQLVYTYPEAENLVKSFPNGGLTFPKIPTVILGTVLIGGAVLWYLQNPVADERNQPENTAIASQNNTDTLQQDTTHKNALLLKNLLTIGEDFQDDSSAVEEPFFAGTTPVAPVYEIIEKENKDEEYLVLDPDKLKKLGIIYKENESVRYELRNGRKKNLYKLFIEFEGSQYQVESARSDTLRFSDFESTDPFPVLFIKTYPEYAGSDPLRCTDPSIPVAYKKVAFEHLRDQLIPVMVEAKVSYGTVRYIFYFAANHQFTAHLPPGTHKKWRDKDEFDWNEYESYREMLWQRYKDYNNDLAKKVKQRLLNVHAQSSNPAELKKLGIDYNGRTLKTVINIYANGKLRGRSTLILSGGGMSFLNDDPPPSAKQFPQPYLFSDSSFKTMMLLMIPDDNYIVSFDKRMELNELALSMLDTLVPVIIPLKAGLKERIIYRNKLYGPKSQHIIFWYRKQDLEAVGFSFDK